ncbi:RhoGAP domain containing protein [Histomonas meleagridis]|uniref:RhoGAP domain containing protein n=1 Tax=Histomonas meleagridis TaxID=135588 RepID=UPI003559A5DD|nr:RhoGAP domain containing protein [Histomonas meleagridis]KAH0800991.1 RhoGAP domain containing protein [Histomonas meleagridis]
MSETKRVVHFFELPPESFRGKIPFPVSQLITQLRNLKAENVEGLFRLNGSDVKTKELCEALDHGPVEDWSKYSDVHTVATALKRYFRAMSQIEPLIPYDCFDCVVAMMALRDEEKEIEVCKSILRMLDKSRFNILGYLLDYLYFVSENSSNNFMTPNNLAICLAPNICVSNQSSSPKMNDSLVANSAIEFMIKNYKKIFTDFDINKIEYCTQEDILECLAPPINMKHLEYQIMKCNLRRNHTIKFLPTCKYSSSAKYKRPTRPPPPKPDSSIQQVMNIFDSFIIKMEQTKSTVAGFIKDVRNSVSLIEPINIKAQPPPIAVVKKDVKTVSPARPPRVTPPCNMKNANEKPHENVTRPKTNSSAQIQKPQQIKEKQKTAGTTQPINGLVIRTYRKGNRRPPKAATA